jgi:hypothetical protein
MIHRAHSRSLFPGVRGLEQQIRGFLQPSTPLLKGIFAKSNKKLVVRFLVLLGPTSHLPLFTYTGHRGSSHRNPWQDSYLVLTSAGATNRPGLLAAAERGFIILN